MRVSRSERRGRDGCVRPRVPSTVPPLHPRHREPHAGTGLPPCCEHPISSLSGCALESPHNTSGNDPVAVLPRHPRGDRSTCSWRIAPWSTRATTGARINIWIGPPSFDLGEHASAPPAFVVTCLRPLPSAAPSRRRGFAASGARIACPNGCRPATRGLRVHRRRLVAEILAISTAVCPSPVFPTFLQHTMSAFDAPHVSRSPLRAGPGPCRPHTFPVAIRTACRTRLPRS